LRASDPTCLRSCPIGKALCLVEAADQTKDGLFAFASVPNWASLPDAFSNVQQLSPSLAWIPTERNSPDMMLGETVHFESLCPAPIRRNGALIAGLRCVSSHIDLAILANSEVSEAK
jgi:hypothetical protein